jgi:hypothetical protein
MKKYCAGQISDALRHFIGCLYSVQSGLLSVRFSQSPVTEPFQIQVFQKEIYNGIPNVDVWRVLRKRLHLKAYKLSIVQSVELWIVYMPLSVATQ